MYIFVCICIFAADYEGAVPALVFLDGGYAPEGGVAPGRIFNVCMDFHGFRLIWMDLDGFSCIYMDLHRFSWIWMDFQ